MNHMGYEISEDGRTEWRNNGGCIERRAMHSGNNKWESDYSHAIIDYDGNHYVVHAARLIVDNF